MHLNGLSLQEVEKRRQQGFVNVNTDVKTKSIGQIMAGHILTLFNGLNLALALALLFVGSFKNMMFMGVVFSNTAIGIFQEIRSKRMVDRLAIVVSNRARVIREGKETEIHIEEIVKDDLIHLSRGNQIPADCRILQGSCYMNESLITGESDLIEKSEGSQLLSGSFVASGDCLAKVEHVGKENYAAQISSEAKQVKIVNSEIMTTLKTIIKYVSWLIVPAGAILFMNQFTIPGATIKAAIVNSVAALIGMIPEGLMLLTSSVLAVSVIRLAQQNVLVQQLYCIETLARVDVLCLDKTGTITCDQMQVQEVIPLPEASESELKKALRSFAVSSRDEGSTIQAIKSYFNEGTAWRATQIVDFSSEKKWSGARYENGYTYVVGAGEMLLGEGYEDVEAKIRERIETHRVLLLCRSAQNFKEKDGLPDGLQPMGFVLIQDMIREEAPDTIRYFTKQGVRLKVISGDGIATVSQIAHQAGVPDAEEAVDARTLESDEQIKEAAERYHVFGRVTPVQKRKLIQALKEKGHTVAMTGDGVNDVLALREADCSVAMAGGSDAARNVAQLVLTDNNFSSMPKVVAEGRRSINNIQRSASLFLMKTIFSLCIGVIFVFLHMRYPFQPIQMTFISTFTIGIPSFVLALQPNKERVQGHFFYNVVTRAVAGGVTMTFGVVMTYIAEAFLHLSYAQTSTIIVLLTAVTGIFFVIRIAYPFNAIRIALLVVVISGITIGMIWGGSLLGLVRLPIKLLLMAAIGCVINCVVFNGIFNGMEKLRKKKTRQI